MAADLRTNVGALSLKTPILAASGTFGYGVEFAELIDLSALGGFVTKGLSLRPRKGNPPPRIHDTACGMLNSIGLHNIGVEAFLRDKVPLLRKIDTRIIANIYGETPDDFVEVAKALASEERIDAVEVNVSCPNVAKGGLDLGTDPDLVRDLLARIRRVYHKPMWAKLTPNVTDVRAIARAAIDGGADALSLINSVRAMALDWKTRRPHLSSRFGGLTGPAIKPIALARVFEVAMNFDIPIVGIGGIANETDVLEFLVAGASAVQIGTQNFVRADACVRITEGLKSTLEREKIATVRELVRGMHEGPQKTP